MVVKQATNGMQQEDEMVRNWLKHSKKLSKSEKMTDSRKGSEPFCINTSEVDL